MPVIGSRLPAPARDPVPAAEDVAEHVADNGAAAFSTWMNDALRGGARDVDEGARLFAAAAAGSTFAQAKVALVQTATHLQKIGLQDAFFVAVQPFLLQKADSPEARREIERGKVTFDVEIPGVADAWEAAAQAFEATLPPAAADRATGAQSQIAARVGAVRPRLPEQPGDAEMGAFLGRLLSNVLRDDEAAHLDAMAAQEKVDAPLLGALRGARIMDGVAGGDVRLQRIAAGMAFARRCESGARDAGDDALIAVHAQAGSKPEPTFAPPSTIKDGDLETVLLRWIGVTTPRLQQAAVMHHPHIPEPSQLTGTSRVVDAVAAESGRFLADYNVLTVMHQLGSAPPWLTLLHDRLGLAKEDYLGVAVPYSASAIAIDRLNREGFRTLNDHDPNPNPLARALGANRRSFDDLKEADVQRAVAEMLKKSDANGKKILVIDDGGYVIKVLRKHFPQHEHRCKIVEWTTRGIRQLESVPNPRAPVVAAAETAPKTQLEPAFIADSTVLHFLAAVGPRLGGVAGKRILVVGAGNIGNAVALALAERGAIVSLHDKDPRKLSAAPRSLAAERDLRWAVKGKDAILAATGANSLGPEVFGLIDPGTLVASASSVDIETRDPKNVLNGHWEQNLTRTSIRVSTDPIAASRGSPPGMRDAFARHLPAGLHVDVEAREILGGGFVLNLSRRARIMPIEREELILMNVTEALAVAHHTDAVGKVPVERRREERIERVFAEEHPREYARALQLR